MCRKHTSPTLPFRFAAGQSLLQSVGARLKIAGPKLGRRLVAELESVRGIEKDKVPRPDGNQRQRRDVVLEMN